MPMRFRDEEDEKEPGSPQDDSDISILEKLKSLIPQEVKDQIPDIDQYKKSALEGLAGMKDSFVGGLEKFENEYNALTPQQKAEQALGMAMGTTSGISKVTNVLKTEVPKRFSQLLKTKPTEFSEALGKAKEINPRIKEFLSEYTPEQYAKMKTYLHPDKQSGYAITPDNELVSVFSALKGRGDELVKDALKRGANKLDAFDGYLTKDLYPKHGFKEVAREANWTPGQPDVVKMAVPQGGFRERLAPETANIMPRTLTNQDPIIQGLRQKAEQAPQMDSARFDQIIRNLLKRD